MVFILNNSSCDRVGPYCPYKRSGSESESVSLEGKFKGQATYYNETKVGTQYSTCGIERGESLDEDNQKVYSAALNKEQFDPYTVGGIPSSNPICQKKALVKGPEGEIVVRFVDRCPDCKESTYHCVYLRLVYKYLFIWFSF